MLQMDGIFGQSMQRVKLDLVPAVAQHVEQFGQANVLVSLLSDLVVGEQLPLIYHDALDAQVTELDAVSLGLRHLQHSRLPVDYVCLDLKLLEVVQML